MHAVGHDALRKDAARYLAAGALLLLLGVMLGAFGAHALRKVLSPQLLASYQTGVSYQLLHAMGLLVIGIIAQLTRPGAWIARAGLLIMAGVILFSGSLYALALGAPRWVGVVTPIGGVAFMLSWICVALHVRASR